MRLLPYSDFSWVLGKDVLTSSISLTMHYELAIQEAIIWEKGPEAVFC